jgi:hypothetical protein
MELPENGILTITLSNWLISAILRTVSEAKWWSVYVIVRKYTSNICWTLYPTVCFRAYWNGYGVFMELLLARQNGKNSDGNQYQISHYSSTWTARGLGANIVMRSRHIIPWVKSLPSAKLQEYKATDYWYVESMNCENLLVWNIFFKTPYYLIVV